MKKKIVYVLLLVFLTTFIFSSEKLYGSVQAVHKFSKTVTLQADYYTPSGDLVHFTYYDPSACQVDLYIGGTTWTPCLYSGFVTASGGYLHPDITIYWSGTPITVNTPVPYY
ncbi:MAG: hypothetical protein J0G98_11650 [Terrimonas ferruginea]|jgi:hypothetical protein|uniref:hypothetical protein n=1 Tax=Terrimonas ferruginea TaxID=249 RepID=UPI000925CE6F|nr:hypothetical protein [Terrimonas ferruginea]MBN8783713.1 hypothetical protein [Terrimonas ferruginea]OJW40764.1 MAG: hypothetical protein BGO56_07975 [Sphingobacteriales bacterium 48-107]